MKTVGIIGGVGPDTTAKIYLEIINRFRKNGELSYPSIVIYNMPFSFFLEKDAAIKGINTHKMLPHLIYAAKILQKAGADFGILPCNTLHKYIAEIRASVRIPFISIIEEIAGYVAGQKVKKVGILGTNTTNMEKIYDNVLMKEGILAVYPNLMEQKELSCVIDGILMGNININYKEQIKKISLSLYARGAEAILLGCTDLHLVSDAIPSQLKVIDTTEILIEATIRELTNS